MVRRLAKVAGLGLGLALVAAAPVTTQNRQAPTAAPAAPAVRIAYLFSDGNVPGTLAAYKALLRARPELRARVGLTLLTESTFNDVAPAEISSANVLLLDTMNQQMLDRYNQAHGVDLIAAVRRRGQVLAIGEGLMPKERYVSQGARFDDVARGFWAHSGFNNQVGLLKLAFARAGVPGLTIPTPEPSLELGYYYPAQRSAGPDDSASFGALRAPVGPAGRVFGTWDEFAAWRQQRGKAKPGAPRVALAFYKSSFYSGETELLDAVIAEIEKRGGEAIPYFGYPRSEERRVGKGCRSRWWALL